MQKDLPIQAFFILISLSEYLIKETVDSLDTPGNDLLQFFSKSHLLIQSAQKVEMKNLLIFERGKARFEMRVQVFFQDFCKGMQAIKGSIIL